MVGRTRIKVCGITRSEDARFAVAAGVDALGFIFAEKSQRKVDPDQARQIIRDLPPFVDAVGVFVNADPDLVREIAEYCGLTVVQLHGQESAEYCQAMPVRVVKAFSIRPETTDREFAPYAGVASGLLFDTWHEKLAGGTGEAFDWSLLARFAIPRPLILAGGLGPDNVAAAVRQVRPFAVDVNSGVEVSPGVKDQTLISAVVREVRRADLEFCRQQ
ncbi:MAG TPA: phosphoribosylanthranilate isomerase [Desulfurivibrionaceae bacterium]|nr:phosphoribosylanthranilate isomerase [Desulfurivibrionaceae bacterium]